MRRVKPVATVAVVSLLLAAASADTLFRFPGGASGGSPVNTGSLALDASGNLYGTTSEAGDYGYGTVFQVSRDGKQSVLYSFHSGDDGAFPLGTVALDASAENIYGTTLSGGSCKGQAGAGTVFQLSKSGSVWKKKILHVFCGADGSAPYGGVILAPGKRGCCYLYGATESGGVDGVGVVFGISQKGKYHVIHSFCKFNCKQVDGNYPQGGVILDNNGNLYGMTFAGGSSPACLPEGCGTVFKVSGSNWTETVLYSFCSRRGCADGAYPQYASLTLAANGTIFGVTASGGAKNNNSGNGTVFELASSGSSWNETVIYSFPDGTKHGAKPLGTLAMDAAGNLYGTTDLGGPGTCNLGCGTVFELAYANGGWTENILYSFQGQGDGSNAESGLVLDKYKSSGKLYGVTN